MSERDNGGPAFPARPSERLSGGMIASANEGMTLRDWFAGQALAGLMARGMPTADDAAWAAFAAADAMLEARK